MKRSVGLFLAVLYGLGVTIGAGIYVLIGAAAGRAGIFAPTAFVLAGVIMGLTACSFGELVGRMPVSAGEAAYVGAGFGSQRLAQFVGLLVIVAAIIAAAAITKGSVGYIRLFAPISPSLLTAGILVIMGAIAAIGMLTSAWVAGVMTLIEITGLLVVIIVGLADRPSAVLSLHTALPALGDGVAWSGVFAATMLAFFAFIGFEGLVNIAEEVKSPEYTLPRAIFLTLAISTLLYILVVWVALSAVPQAELSRSQAPLALVFERVTGASPAMVTAIAIIATLNGIIAQIVLGSRVMYGLAVKGQMPAIFSMINARTHTPIVATLLVTGSAILFATALPIELLADFTSIVMLIVFFLVNTALALIKYRGEEAPVGTFIAPSWIPVGGALTCIAALALAAFR